MGHTRGAGARTLTMYGDYECPHTRTAYRIVQSLEADGIAFAFEYRHLPIAEAHEHALAAAVAAEAAHDQGRFWEMHDALFAGQDDLSRAALRAKATAIGLDLERFNSEFASDDQLARVTSDTRAGLEAGATGTPSLFVDGVPMTSYEPAALRLVLGGRDA
ncbi:MAG TPA: DsbA family protein [Solirubrobacteraceae bacterium]|nr:DsbA family protein [Solirubrobacteraceae bacterium]